MTIMWSTMLVPASLRDPADRLQFGMSDFLRRNRHTRAKAAVVLMICVALVAAASFRTYAIIGGSGGDVMWNPSEAYIFMFVSNLGYTANGLVYPWVLFKKYILGGFAALEDPTDQRAYLVVIRATSSGVERHVVKLADRMNGGPGRDPSEFTPLEGRIYAYCPWVGGHFIQDGHWVGNDMDHGLCWWTNDHFKKATDEERRRLHGIQRLTKGALENDENGWSRLAFGAGPPYRKST